MMDALDRHAALPETLAAHGAYWNMEACDAGDGPVAVIEVAYTPPDVYHTPPVWGLRVSAEESAVHPEMVDPAEHWRQLEHTQLPAQGSLVPVIAPLGIPWMAAITGCPLFYRRSDPDLTFIGDVWAEPMASSCAELLDRLGPHTGSPWYDKLLECTRLLVEQSRSQEVVSLTLLRGPTDMLGQALGDERMATEFIDHPQDAHHALERLTMMWIDVNRALLELIPKFAGGTVNGYGLWHSGTTVRCQEDHAEILSPRMYREFVVPCNEQIASAFDGVIMHRHAGPMINTLGRLEALLDVEALGAVQVTRDINSPPLERLIEIYALIQTRKPVLVWGGFTQDEIATILDRLMPQGLCIKARAESWVEYHRLVQWLRSQGYAGFS
jgi:hypothetical protein